MASRGSFVPEYLRKPIATFDFPGRGGYGPHVQPLDPPMFAMYSVCS